MLPFEGSGEDEAKVEQYGPSGRLLDITLRDERRGGLHQSRIVRGQAEQIEKLGVQIFDQLESRQS